MCLRDAIHKQRDGWKRLVLLGSQKRRWTGCLLELLQLKVAKDYRHRYSKLKVQKRKKKIYIEHEGRDSKSGTKNRKIIPAWVINFNREDWAILGLIYIFSCIQIGRKKFLSKIIWQNSWSLKCERASAFFINMSKVGRLKNTFFNNTNLCETSNKMIMKGVSEQPFIIGVDSCFIT